MVFPQFLAAPGPYSYVPSLPHSWNMYRTPWFLNGKTPGPASSEVELWLGPPCLWPVLDCRPALPWCGSQYELPQAQNLQDSHSGRASIPLDLGWRFP